MDEAKCVACHEVTEDGFAIGRLCYLCIEKAVIKIIKEEKEGVKS